MEIQAAEITGFGSSGGLFVSFWNPKAGEHGESCIGKGIITKTCTEA